MKKKTMPKGKAKPAYKVTGTKKRPAAKKSNIKDKAKLGLF